jgi:Gram-negative porin
MIARFASLLPIMRAVRHWPIALALLTTASAANSQVVLNAAPAQLTVEAYANFTAGNASEAETSSMSADETRFDGGARVLGRLSLDDGPDIGLRLSAEVNEDEARLVEASVLLFGGNGRLEFGERMGLPDVLTGYAPNNFQFTSAEFGPASGPSLDPAGRLQTAFLPKQLAAQLDTLVSLGGTAALFDDQSAKILYVSPKKRGWLAGVSYARDADDDAIDALIQAGITHESYWQQNVLQQVSVAVSLPRLVSVTRRCLTRNSPQTGSSSGRSHSRTLSRK